MGGRAKVKGCPNVVVIILAKVPQKNLNLDTVEINISWSKTMFECCQMLQ